MYARKLQTILLVMLIAGIAWFQLISISPGQDWGDDWAQYVAHARNIAENRRYSDTGYISNPDEPIAPSSYPPGFPLLLAPIYKLRGLDLEALKIPSILAFVGALGLLAVIAAEWEGPFTAVAVTALVGLHPFFRSFKNEILSDLPFLFFLLVALRVSEKELASDVHHGRHLLRELAVGFLWWFAFAIRTIGVVLPAAVLTITLARRGTRRRVVIPSAVFTILAIVQGFVIQSPGDYLSHFSFHTEGLLGHVHEYAGDFLSLIDPHLGPHAAKVVFAIITPFAVVGAVRLWRRGHQLPLVFSALYVAAVLVWPFHQGVRMLIPLIPFYFLGIVVGVRLAAERIRRARYVVIAAACVCGALVYWRQYEAPIPVTPRVETADSQDLFAFIRGSTADSAVMIFKKPRALALYTGRKGSVYSTALSGDPWTYISRIRATHVVTIRRSAQDSTYLRALVQGHPGVAGRVFSNGEFDVHELHPDLK